MGKRDDNIHMKRYCNVYVYVYVYVYLWASVYIGLCLCVHICILIAGCFTICICEIGLSFFSKAVTNTKYCNHCAKTQLKIDTADAISITKLYTVQ